jgi:DNA-binding MarR family transcriptional regulator
MKPSAKRCAREILETVPLVMRFIREQVRQRRTAALTLPQYRALAFLGLFHNASLSAAAEHVGLSLPAVSRLINGLVAGRLVERQTVLNNRRQIALSLTVRGRARLEKARGEVRRQLAGSLKTLSRADQETIQRAMQALHQVFNSQPAVGTRSQKTRP